MYLTLKFKLLSGLLFILFMKNKCIELDDVLAEFLKIGLAFIVLDFKLSFRENSLEVLNE